MIDSQRLVTTLDHVLLLKSLVYHENRMRKERWGAMQRTELFRHVCPQELAPGPLALPAPATPLLPIFTDLHKGPTQHLR